MDRFKQIETFVAVAARGSLSAVAQAEGVAPAVIGRRIDALEDRLGVKLLVRTTRRITLTFEGSAFLEDCQRLLRDFYDAEASVSLGGIKASGHLRVTAPAGFGRAHVAPLLPAFLDAHPDLTISLDLSDRLADIVNEGIDVAIRIGSSTVRVDQSRLANGQVPDAFPQNDMAEYEGLCSSGLYRLTPQAVRFAKDDVIEIVRSDTEPGTVTTVESVVFSPLVCLDDIGTDSRWIGT